MAFYAAFTGLINLSMLVLTGYLRRQDWLLVDQARSISALSTLIRWEWIGVVTYVALAALAIPAPRLALAGTFLMWVFWALVVATGDEKRPIASIAAGRRNG